MKKIIIGNWKLNLDHLEAIQLLQKLNYTIEEGKEEKFGILIIVIVANIALDNCG